MNARELAARRRLLVATAALQRARLGCEIGELRARRWAVPLVWLVRGLALWRAWRAIRTKV